MKTSKYIIATLFTIAVQLGSAYPTCYEDGTSGQGSTTQCSCQQSGINPQTGQMNCGGSCSKTTNPGIPTCKQVSQGTTGCTTVRGTINIQVSTAPCVANANNTNCVAGTWTNPVSVSQNYQGSASSGGACPNPTPDPSE